MNHLGLSISYDTSGLCEAGLDEAGRGCLAGPVYAAAVVFDRQISPKITSQLRDSKKMTKKARAAMRLLIEDEALDYGVARVDNREIDKINILNASILAMHRAIQKLNPKPALLLVDGNRFHRYENLQHHCIVKGDSLFYSIAAASVIAKTYRDAHMLELHSKHPEYLWDKNKGYPTPAHRDAIRKHGLSPLHRRSFNTGLQIEIVF